MFIVARKNGTWEARESGRTPDGPRSRTLATFRELTPDVASLIAERSSVPIGPEEITRIASRTGVPVILSEADRAAASLLRQIATGNNPRPGLMRLINGDEDDGHEADRMKLWAGASRAERGRALTELLDLGDALPAGRRRGPRDKFPKISSRA